MAKRTKVLGNKAPKHWWDEIKLLRDKVAALELENAKLREQRGARKVLKAHGVYCDGKLQRVESEKETAEAWITPINRLGLECKWRVLPVDITETGLQQLQQSTTEQDNGG